MCGRFTLTATAEMVADELDLADVPELAPRYNIAPTQVVPIVRARPEGLALSSFTWGLVPSWARDPKISASLINARAETAADKPAFRSAFKTRRCLVVADGFFEWRREGKQRLPLWFRLRDGAIFTFAGLYEHWAGSDGRVIDSCTILTTEANELVRPVHDRMPVILERLERSLWLSGDLASKEDLLPLLRPLPPSRMVAIPVSGRVNNARNDDPECVVPLAEQGSLL